MLDACIQQVLLQYLPCRMKRSSIHLLSMIYMKVVFLVGRAKSYSKKKICLGRQMDQDDWRASKN
ncbi:hypothetical protein HMPREF3213_01257 [Heyndrickxia coagulans]|uniref:Uncharacterized protein n=1 Tax=Heyndrickxia coagulans TaxID=1398 RepID=A0A133KVB2_HEYCO|nr:hypothetical protein HMPREF3213_01257 [Heyndrickxia coagulans]